MSLDNEPAGPRKEPEISCKHCKAVPRLEHKILNVEPAAPFACTNANAANEHGSITRLKAASVGGLFRALIQSLLLALHIVLQRLEHGLIELAAGFAAALLHSRYARLGRRFARCIRQCRTRNSERCLSHSAGRGLSRSS